MGRAERANQERRLKEGLLREGLLHFANGMAKTTDALAVTIVATYTVSDETDDRGMVEARTFNYSAYRSSYVAIPHLEQAERVIRDAIANLQLAPDPHPERNGGLEVDNDLEQQLDRREAALREAEGDDGDGGTHGAPRLVGEGDPDAQPGPGDEEGPEGDG